MKKILYVSRLCSPVLMEYIFATSVYRPALSAQKFHRLLTEGFAMYDDGCDLETLSAIPITPAGHKRRIWCLPREKEGNITYNYVPTLNLPIIKNLLVFILAFFKAFVWGLRGGKKDKYVICDVLNVSVSAATLLACKLTGVRSTAIVTDLPNLMIGGAERKSMGRRIYNKIVSTFTANYDGYVLLTEQMNAVVNPRLRPYMIMEGLVDVNMASADNRLEAKSAEKIILYAGGIYEKYGVKMLIDAFMQLKGDDLRLHIYGPGPMADEMPGYCQKDRRIVYFGMVDNHTVVQAQLAATLLVNPRPSDLELAKYSFPSKNMEYMASGTPLVTTPLPGMPREYHPFVYRFEDETVEGFQHMLAGLLAKSRQELHDFGQKAQEFALAHKNNYIQANRILSFWDR